MNHSDAEYGNKNLDKNTPLDSLLFIYYVINQMLNIIDTRWTKIRKNNIFSHFYLIE